VAKTEPLAREIDSTKTSAVEQAVDRLMAERGDSTGSVQLLEQMDRIPERSEPLNPLEWDEHCLPR